MSHYSFQEVSGKRLVLKFNSDKIPTQSIDKWAVQSQHSSSASDCNVESGDGVFKNVVITRNQKRKFPSTSIPQCVPPIFSLSTKFGLIFQKVTFYMFKDQLNFHPAANTHLHKLMFVQFLLYESRCYGVGLAVYLVHRLVTE